MTSQASNYCTQTNIVNIRPLKDILLTPSSAPLRQLTKTGVHSKWTEEYQTEFERLKDLTADNTVLRRDGDDKTSALESNSGDLLWGPPQQGSL